jgi:type II secretory pathway predicted ATPase ExeA
MYLSYYNLKKRPFQITTDPEILWWGDGYRKVCDSLKKDVSEGGGLIVFLGDIGLGKTTLINALIQSIEDNILVAKLAAPDPESFDFYNFVAGSFGLDLDFRNQDELLSALADFFRSVSEYGQKIALIIDEAHLCNHTHLEEIYDLLSLGESQNWAVTVVLVGQNELQYNLANGESGILSTKITGSYQIEPLTRNETDDYIHHYLKLAGSEKRIFSFDAIEEIYAFSRGNPHLINILCDLTLATGCVKDTGTINSTVVAESAKKLQLRKPAREDELESRSRSHLNRLDFSANMAPKKISRWAFYLALPAGALIIGSYFFFSSQPITANKLGEPIVIEKKVISIQPDNYPQASITQNILAPAANDHTNELSTTNISPVFKKTPSLQDNKYSSLPVPDLPASQRPAGLDDKTSTTDQDRDTVAVDAPQDLVEKTEIMQVKKPSAILPEEIAIEKERTDQIGETESPPDEPALGPAGLEKKDSLDPLRKTETSAKESLIEPAISGEMEDQIEYEVIANQMDRDIVSDKNIEEDRTSKTDASAPRKQDSDTVTEEPDPTNVIDWLIKKRSQ